jgi:hypothetical protein
VHVGYDTAGENALVLFHLPQRRCVDGDHMGRKSEYALDTTGVKTSVDKSHRTPSSVPELVPPLGVLG